MLKQIRTLTSLQLKNLYGMNVFRHTKDKEARKKSLWLGVAWIFVMAMICFYLGGMAYGYILIGMAEILPAYFIMLSSMIILGFAIFKAGNVIFQRNAYDILCSLPVSQMAIVVSRFARMYVENLMLTFLLMLPGMVVYGVMIKPAITFYIVGIVVVIFVPLLPITLATFLGALVTAIASRMKHKSLVSALLSVLLVVGILGLSPQMATMEEEFSIEMLQQLSEMVLSVIESIFPPAIWMGNAMLGKDYLPCAFYLIGAVAAFIITMVFISANYQRISQRLYSTAANHNYKLQSLKRQSILIALIKREAKRYFASSVYVTNTIVGPILAVVFAGAMMGLGIDEMQQSLGLPIDISGLIPFLLAGIFCVMGTTCTAISMEGKEWWIVKSLPIRTKDILDSKIVFQLLLEAPFYLVAEILLIIALKPSFLECVWLILIPAVSIVFASVFGLFVNLKMPVFNWENEVTVVKQSASAALGGLGALLVMIVCMVPVIFVPAAYADLLKGFMCIVIVGVTVLLYQKGNRTNLLEL